MAIGIHADAGDATTGLVAEVKDAIARDERQRAYDISNRAISRGRRHALFFKVRAERWDESGHLEFALDDYQRAADLSPNDADAFDALAVCAFRLNDFERVIGAYSAALALTPNSADLHYRYGLALAQSGDSRGAQRAYERALELEPDFAEALASLALTVARRGDAARAREFAERALILAPEDTTATLALAQADLAEHRYHEAELRLRTLFAAGTLAMDAQAVAFAMLGDALDGQGQYADAFAAYTSENRAALKSAAPNGDASGLDAARHLIAYFENEPAARWIAPHASDNGEAAVARHVFLVGFMRSGTTLLQQVLAVNPRVVVSEEQALLAAVGDRYMTGVPALDRLANLSGEQLASARHRYWEKARVRAPHLAHKVFLDKHPMNTARLPVAAKLFPNACGLLAVRDPRDVVFSCFRRNLRAAATPLEFRSLERCARFYAATMRLAELFQEKLSLRILVHRYEDMIRDFDNRVRAVCDFIGIEWMDAMRQFDTQAPAPDLLSPSATQVRRPLYEEGIGHWRNYAEQLKPVRPILEPWVEKFGYPPD